MGGVFDNLKWYEHIYIFIAFSILHGPQVIYEKSRDASTKAYDVLCDNYDSLSSSVTSISAEISHRTGLSKRPHLRRTFPQFMKLPADIRYLIWEFAIPDPRVIEMRLKSDALGKNLAFQSICQLPALLHTCQESRAIGLKFYHLAFSTCSAPAMTYVDFSRDIIYFGKRADFNYYRIVIWFKKEKWDREGFSDFENIQRIAFGMRLHSDLGGVRREELKSLREMFLIKQDASQRKWDLGSTPMLRHMDIEPWGGLSSVAERRCWAGNVEGRALPEVLFTNFVKAPGDRW